MAFSLIEAVVNAVVLVLSTVGLPGLFALMTVESFGIPPVPSEVILPFSGFLIAEGTFPLDGALVAALGGGLAGSYIAYAVGRWGRHRLVDLGIGPFRLEARHLARMDSFFQRYGEATVGFARLVPVVRSYISYPAGTARMGPVRFGTYTLIGSVPFTLGFLYAGIVLGSRWKSVAASLQWVNVVAGALVVLAIIYVALVLLGILAPGWPPRRKRAGSPETASRQPSGDSNPPASP